MITQGTFGYMVTCDNCGEELNVYTEMFYAAVDEAKQCGWRISKDEHDNWCHTCPDCRKNEEP